MAPFSQTQGSASIQISSTFSGFSQASPYAYYLNGTGLSATNADSFTITFGDGRAVRLTDFNRLSGPPPSSSYSNILGIPAATAAGFTNSFNINGGQGDISNNPSTYDVYDALSGQLLLDDYRPQGSGSDSYIDPYAQFGYSAATGRVSVSAPRRVSGIGYADISTGTGEGLFSPAPNSYVGGFSVSNTPGTGASSSQYYSGGSSSASWVFVLTPAPEPICFVEGTSILMWNEQYQAIEQLQVGDQLVTTSGMRRVKFVHRRHYSPMVIRLFPQTLPVRVSANSFGDGFPSSDLLVSQRHGLLLGGYAFAAKMFVNELNITVCSSGEFVGGITYFHIEFDQQEVVMASGLWTESYSYADNRSEFDNASEYERLYGDINQPCHPMGFPPSCEMTYRRLYAYALKRGLGCLEVLPLA